MLSACEFDEKENADFGYHYVVCYAGQSDDKKVGMPDSWAFSWLVIANHIVTMAVCFDSVRLNRLTALHPDPHHMGILQMIRSSKH